MADSLDALSGGEALSPLDLGLPSAYAGALQPQSAGPAGPGPMPMPPNVAQDPRQRLAMLTALGFMLGAGPKSGLAQGAAQGTLGAQAHLQDLLNQRFQIAQQEARRQETLQAVLQAKAAAEEQQRQRQLMTALQTIKKRVDTIPTKDQYDTEIEGYANALRGAGYRLDGNWLRRAVPFVAPTAEKRATMAIDAFLKNPANKTLLEQHPDQLSKVMLSFDRDGDGLPEQVPLMAVAQLAGKPFAVDASGQLITYPKGTTLNDQANANGIFQTLLTKAKAEGKNTDDPTIRMALQEEAIKRVHLATPAKEPTSSFQLQPEIDPETGKQTGNFFSFNTKTNQWTTPSGRGPQATKAGPAAQVVKDADKRAALGTLDQLDAAINDARAFIGPGAGRVSSIEQLIGNPDPKLQALGTKMMLAKMKVDAGIGGARAAASPQLLARWDKLFGQNMTPEALHATVQAMREVVGGMPPAQKSYLSTDPNAGQPMRTR